MHIQVRTGLIDICTVPEKAKGNRVQSTDGKIGFLFGGPGPLGIGREGVQNRSRAHGWWPEMEVFLPHSFCCLYDVGGRVFC